MTNARGSGNDAGAILNPMQFGGTVLYVDDVHQVVDFYKKAFGLELAFFDEALGFAELRTGGSLLAIATSSASS